MEHEKTKYLIAFKRLFALFESVAGYIGMAIFAILLFAIPFVGAKWYFPLLVIIALWFIIIDDRKNKKNNESFPSK